MPNPCPSCGGIHDHTCGQALGPLLAEHLIDHPEDLEVAILAMEIAKLQAKLADLTAEVHQHY